MREYTAAAHKPSSDGARKQPAPSLFGAGSAFGSSLEGRSLSSSWRYASAAESPDSGAGGGSRAGQGPYDAAAAQPWPPVPPVSGGAAYAAPPPLASPPSPTMAMGSPTSAPGREGFGAAGCDMGGMPAAAEDGSRQQLWSPSKRPALQGGHSQQFQACVPPGMDPAAYAAGERAALMSAFQQALPGQQALGQLFSAVDSLHSRLEEEAHQWRQQQMGAARASGMMETALQRLDALEFQRLPQLQEELGASRSPQELLAVMGSLQEVLAILTQQRQLLAERSLGPLERGGGGGFKGGFKGGRLHWLLLAAAGYGQSLLSKADVAALIFSRKLLLTPADGTAADGADLGRSAGRHLRSALSVALFVASLEAAWQAQRRLVRPLPVLAQRMAAPALLGLRVARVAVWSAALVLAAAQTRASCQAASDSVCSAVEEAASAVRLPAWVQALPLLRWWQRRQAELAAAAAAEEGCPGSDSESCCDEVGYGAPAAARHSPSPGKSPLARVGGWHM